MEKKMDKQPILIFNAQDITIHNYLMCLWFVKNCKIDLEGSSVAKYLHM